MTHFYSSLLPILITRRRWALLLLLLAARGMALAQTITSLAPASGPVGTSVTITGANLTGATSVRFNGAVQSTILSNTATSLAVAVPAGATTGLVTVTTAGGTSNGASFTVTVVPLAITAVSPTANVRNALTNSPVAVTFNQALASTSAPALKVYSAQRGGLRTRGTTPGVVSGSTLTYAPAQPWVAGETVLSTVTTAATSSAGGTLASAKVVRFTAAVAGTGRGTFSGTTNYPVPVPNGNTDHLAMGDVDGDGDLDMLTANDNSNGTVSVRFNNGTGTFSGTQNVAVDGFPRVVELADVDGDGDLDFLAVNYRSSTANSSYGSSVSVRLNNGAGVFSGTQNVETGDFSYGLAIGDLDGDGDLDFATANYASTDVRVRLNNGTGTFSAGVTISLPNIYPEAVAMGDVDGDGDLDMLSSGGSGTVSVLLNNGNATFRAGTSASAYADYNLTLGDVDGDGDLDLVAAAQNSNNVQIRINNGVGVFSGGQNIAVTTGPRGVALGDLDADGDLDLVTNNIGLTTNYGNTVSVRFNNGAGFFSAQATTPDLVVGTLPWHVALADIDGDGDLDVLTANNNSTVSLRFNGPAMAPTITSFTPASGLVGTQVTVTGTDFTGATAVALGGTAVLTYTVVSATTLTFNVPAGAAPGFITITTPGGVATSSVAFTVTPVITALSPASAVAGSGTFLLTVSGTGFGRGALVYFDGAPLVTTYTSATQLTATVPAAAIAAAGTYRVNVSNSMAVAGGTSSLATFTVTAPVLTPTISSFSPASGAPGTQVTVTGTNFTGATAVTLNGVAVPSFSVATATTLVFTVPAAATTGLIAITTPAGKATSTTAFTVLNPVPVLTSISPNRVLVNSGSFTLTVNGSGFATSSVINFFGSPFATTFVSGTQLTTTIPNTYLTGLSQSTVTVTNPAPGGGTSVGLPFEVYLPAPTVTSFTPTSGPIGTTVTVTGTDFQLVKYVGLASPNSPYATSFTVLSPTLLSFVVPSGSVSGPVSVATSGGTGLSLNDFTVTATPNPAPTVTSLAPSTAVAGSGAFTLTVSGSGFINGTVVNFNGVALPTTYNSATQLTAQVAASAVASAGSFGVTVTTPAPGGGTSAPVTFTVTTPAPTLLSFAPASGLVGTTVTVTGTNLTGATSLTLNGVSVGGFTVVNATTLTFTVPAGATSGLLAVTTPGGTATSASSFTVLLPTPTITSLAPNSAVAGSGAFALTLTGTGFLPGSAVSFNGSALTTSYVSGTQLTAAVPASAVAAAGTYAVVVANPTADQGGTSGSVPFSVTTPTPTLLSFAPASGLVGTLVTVTGTNLLGTTTVTLNGASVGGFTVLDASTLTFPVPVGATSGLVAVTTPGGTATSASVFTVLLPNPLPTLASLSPSAVVAGSPAFTLTLSGTDFVAGSVVNLAGAVLPTTYVSATQLTAAVPASAVAVAGSYDVAVASPAPGGGTSATLALLVTVPAPTITSFSPQSGPVGTTVTVVGTNFSGATALTLNGLAVGSFAVASATTASFVVPAGATSGAITVTTPGGTAVSGDVFTVITPNPAPVIVSLAPASAVAGSGALTLTITGTGFLGNSVVSFAGTPLSTTNTSATQLTALVPATLLATAGSYDVVVRNPAPGGGASVPATFTVTAPAPTLLSFAPASGLVGTTVTVTGTNLTGATSLTLNGVSVGGFTVVTATTLTFVVPTGATSGLVAVTTPGGTATSASSFTVLLPNPVPTLLSLSPSTAVAGSPAFTLTLSGADFRSGAVVSFNASPLATTYVSATQLTAVVPAAALAVAGRYEVLVSTPAPGGGSSAALPFVVTVPVPTISSFTPTAGGASTLVTLTGTNLTGATEVRIGTVLIPSFTVVSATSLTLVVPASSGVVSGFITVITPGGTATSATAFSGVLATAGQQALPELQVYPNPFQTTLTIVLPNAAAAQIALYDMAGRLVVPLTPLPASGQLLLPHDLATGVYLLEVQQGATISRRRLVRQ